MQNRQVVYPSRLRNENSQFKFSLAVRKPVWGAFHGSCTMHGDYGHQEQSVLKSSQEWDKISWVLAWKVFSAILDEGCHFEEDCSEVTCDEGWSFSKHIQECVQDQCTDSTFHITGDNKHQETIYSCPALQVIHTRYFTFSKDGFFLIQAWGLHRF